jgi:hypothetical protein
VVLINKTGEPSDHVLVRETQLGFHSHATDRVWNEIGFWRSATSLNRSQVNFSQSSRQQWSCCHWCKNEQTFHLPQKSNEIYFLTSQEPWMLTVSKGDGGVALKWLHSLCAETLTEDADALWV